MATLPTQPPVARIPIVARFQAPAVPSYQQPVTPRSFIADDLGDWEVKVATSLHNAVPADVDRTIITLHKHEVIIERQDFLYRTISVVENALVIASSVFLVGISAASVIFALSTMAIDF